jgi:starch phosphorylase
LRLLVFLPVRADGEEVAGLKSTGYNPRDIYDSNGELKEAIDIIGSGLLSQGDPSLFKPLIDCLLYRDEYLLLADYQSYVDTQSQVDIAYRDRKRWVLMSIL